MKLLCFRDNGTMAIPFRIERINDAHLYGTSGDYFRVIFAHKYAVDIFQGTCYADVIKWIQKSYNCSNLNFDTVELC